MLEDVKGRADQPTQTRSGLAEMIMSVVLFLVMIVALAIWSVVGLLFWLPILTWAIVVFSSLIVYVTLARQDPRLLGRNLETATRFYVDGFRKIIQAVYAPMDDFDQTQPPAKLQISLSMIALNVLVVCLFWVLASVILLNLR